MNGSIRQPSPHARSLSACNVNRLITCAEILHLEECGGNGLGLSFQPHG